MSILLAEQQKEVLGRRFPNYKHVIERVHLILDCHLRVEHPNKVAYGGGMLVLLVASFSSSSVKISHGGSTPPWSWSIVIDYADPEFTEDFLSDILSDVLEKARTR